MKYIVLIVSCLFCVSGFALDDMRMRDRVFVDKEAGISFRYPYECYLPNPYKHKIVGVVYNRHSKEKMRVSYRYFSYLKSSLPKEVDAKDLLAVMRHIGKHDFQDLIDYSYYRSDPCFPHRHERWARAGIRGAIAHADDEEMILIDHHDRFSGLFIVGECPINDDVVNSFEIMRYDETDKQFKTWNHWHTDKGYGIIKNGELVKLSKMKRPESWKHAYELETEHFHITTTCTPRYIEPRIEFLETMYAGLRKWLPCPDDIHDKYEVHITKTRKEFNEIGDYLYGDVNRAFNVRSNATLGGFFHPMTRSIYTFTDKVKYSRMTSTVRLAHEFVHQYMFMNSSYNFSMPGWFNEGIAVFFEGGFKDKQHKKVVPATTRVRLLKMVYKDHGFLGDLKLYMRGYGIGNVHQYAEAYAIIHQQLKAADGQQKLLDFWQQYRSGKNGVKAYYQVFALPSLNHDTSDESYAKWKKSIMNYVKGGRAAKVTTFER